jgi:hypothetical protein
VFRQEAPIQRAPVETRPIETRTAPITFRQATPQAPVQREQIRPVQTRNDATVRTVQERTVVSRTAADAQKTDARNNDNRAQDKRVNDTRGESNRGNDNRTKGNSADDARWRNDGGHVKDFRGNHGDTWRHDYDRRSGLNIDFSFGLYLNAPVADCVVSPWYDYPVLPGYLPVSAVTVRPVACAWDAGAAYSIDNGYDSTLNLAVEEINAMFQNQSLSALDALIPPSGQVSIFDGENYMYNLDDGAFRQMMADNIQNVDTTSFQVTGVHINGSKATVDCEHTFNDPGNGTQTVYQQYQMTMQNGRFVIVDFSTHQ